MDRTSILAKNPLAGKGSVCFLSTLLISGHLPEGLVMCLLALFTEIAALVQGKYLGRSA
jgi:hypothetical protein